MEKLNLNQFKNFKLSASSLKSVLGGGWATKKDGKANDYIIQDPESDDCGTTHFASGGTASDPNICDLD